MDLEAELREALIEEKTTSIYAQRRSRYELVLPWSLAVFFFCSTLFFTLRSSLTVDKKAGNYEDGFFTDFGMDLDPLVWMSLTGASFYPQHTSTDRQDEIHERPAVQCHHPIALQPTSRSKRNHIYWETFSCHQWSLASAATRTIHIYRGLGGDADPTIAHQSDMVQRQTQLPRTQRLPQPPLPQ